MEDELNTAETLEVILPEEEETAEVQEPVAESETEEGAEQAEAIEESEQDGEQEVSEDGQESAESGEEQDESSENELVIENSSLTDQDLYEKIRQAVWDKNIDGYISYLFPEDHIVWVHCWDPDFSDLEYMQFIYTVNGEEVTVDDGVKIKLEATVLSMSQALSKKNEALVEASQRIKGLEAEVAELRPFKEAAEAAEAERVNAARQEKVKALEEYAVKSGFITSEEISQDGDIKSMISELNEAGIKQVIAERFMASLQEPQSDESEPETAEIYNEPEVEIASVNLLNGDDDGDVSIISAYIKMGK